MMFIKIILIFALVFATTISYGADNISSIKKKADKGNTKAQLELGNSYANGNGVSVDYSEAMKWYMAAAKNGSARAMNNIGLMYGRGLGVAQNVNEAAKWYQLAADKGNDDAKRNLSAYYMYGDLGAVDMDKALVLLKSSAKSGNVKSMQNLVNLYYVDNEKYGVMKNTREAFKWANKCADKNDTLCMIALGYMYMNNDGIPPNYDKANQYLLLAANLGDDRGAEALARLRSMGRKNNAYNYGMGNSRGGITSREYRDMMNR